MVGLLAAWGIFMGWVKYYPNADDPKNIDTYSGSTD
jgi:hypothetical protein